MKRKQRGSGSGGEGRWEELEGVEEVNCGWDVLYKRRIYSQF